MSWALPAALGALVLLFAAARAVAGRWLRLPTPADARWRLPTADGAEIGLWRYHAAPSAPRRDPPVVLCHGLGATRFNLDLDDELSVARRLAALGFDCFVVQLRGADGPRAAGGGPLRGPARHGYDFDDHLALDVPAALAKVAEVTGARRVLWVGHSMGGMLGYAMLGGALADRLAGLVAIGSPASFAPHRRRLRLVARLAPRLLPCGLPFGLARWIAWLGGWFPLVGLGALANHRNMTGRAIRRTLYNVLGRISHGQLEQFGGWILRERFASRDGTHDYRAGLAAARAPVLLIAGSADRLAPPAAVQVAYDHLGSPDKTMCVVGRATGCVEEYGHGDLVLGRLAAREVVPLIADWLVARSHAADDAR